MSAAAGTLAALRTAVARIEASAEGGLEQGPETNGADGGRRLPLGVAAADAVLGGGLRRGAVHAVSGATPAGAAAATGFAVALAALGARKGRAALWIRQDMAGRENGEPWPMGLAELGLDPARLVLLRARDEHAVLRAAEAALACPGLSVAVIEPFGRFAAFDRVAARRLALAAGRSGVTAVLLRAGVSSLAPPVGWLSAETRWRAAPAASGPEEDWGRPRFSLELVRNRRGGIGRWVLEWRGDERGFSLVERPDASGGTSRWATDPGDRAAKPVDRPAAAAGGGVLPFRRAG
jgi:protein ImuA